MHPQTNQPIKKINYGNKLIFLQKFLNICKQTVIRIERFKINDSIERKIRILWPPNRFLMYSGIVYTPARIYTGINTQPSIKRTNKAFNSNPATAMPELAALPLKPLKQIKFIKASKNWLIHFFLMAITDKKRCSDTWSEQRCTNLFLELN